MYSLRSSPNKYHHWRISRPDQRNHPRSQCTQGQLPKFHCGHLWKSSLQLLSSNLFGTRIPWSQRRYFHPQSFCRAQRSDHTAARPPPTAVLCAVAHIRLRLNDTKVCDCIIIAMILCYNRQTAGNDKNRRQKLRVVVLTAK